MGSRAVRRADRAVGRPVGWPDGRKGSKSEICSKVSILFLEDGHSGPVGREDGPPVGLTVRPPVGRAVGPPVGWTGPSGGPTGARGQNRKFSKVVASWLFRPSGGLSGGPSGPLDMPPSGRLGLLYFWLRPIISVVVPPPPSPIVRVRVRLGDIQGGRR